MATIRASVGVQFRLSTLLNAAEYLAQRIWEQASLESCPLHLGGSCGFSRHTPYDRVDPPGTKIARYRCPTARVTFSLLPDCFASRFPGTLLELEAIVLEVEKAPGPLTRLAAELRPADADLDHVQGTLRHLRRRSRAVWAALAALIGLLPDRFAGHPPTIEGFRAALGQEHVLLTLRSVAADHLRNLPPPLGFGPRARPRRSGRSPTQQDSGPDPPGQLA